MKRITTIATLLAGLGLAGGALAGPGHWTLTGPDGGQVTDVIVDATHADHAVAAGYGGIFRSLDGGTSWQRHQDGLDFTFAAPLRASTHSNRLYATLHGRQVLRGSATGTWQATGFTLPPDPGTWAYDLAIRQDDDDHLLIATRDNLLFLSHDAGASFTQLDGTGIPANGRIQRVAYVSASRLLATFRYHTDSNATEILRSDDGGATWSVGAQVAEFFFPAAPRLAPGRTDADRFYVVSMTYLRRSDDGGDTLTDCGALPGDDLPQVAAVAAHDDALVWAGGLRGLYRSTDACASWTAFGAGLSSDGMRPDTISSIALAGDYETNPRIFVGTASGGLYRSDNGGVSFTLQSQGFYSHNIRALAAHPAQPGHLWAGHGDAVNPNGTVWRSTDAAASWERSNIGLQAMHLRGITVDPTTASLPGGPHLYGVGSSIWSGAPGGYVTDGGIYKSENGGLSWGTIDNGLPETYWGTMRYIGTVRQAVLDPRSCAMPPVDGSPCTSGPLQTAYVTASGRVDWSTGTYAAARVYKSTDAGANWSAIETGLPLPDPDFCGYSQIAVPMAIDPGDPQTLYLGLSLSWNDGPESGCPDPTVANGIFKSTDGGATWVHASDGLLRIGGPGSSHGSVLALALAPSDPQRLYAAAWRYDDNLSFASRIFRSDDGGGTWVERSVGVIGQDVRSLIVDPADPDIVYAASASSGVGRGGVYRSTDGGLTWDSISIGIDGIAATTLIFDPHDAARLYAGTVSGVAEYTQVPDEDIDGVPSEVENGAPYGGDGNQDGTADALQSHVASLPLPIVPARGEAAWLTLWVEPVEGTCTRINNMQVHDPSALPADIVRGPEPTQYAHGIVRFDLPDCQKARVHARFHGMDFDDPRYAWRNYGPLQPGNVETLAWYGFAGASRSAADTWTLDIDGAAQGNWFDNDEVIRFVGGVGYLDLSLFSDDFEMPVPKR